MNSDKKLGRRKAGSYGRTGSRKLQRAANKATRKASRLQLRGEEVRVPFEQDTCKVEPTRFRTGGLS